MLRPSALAGLLSFSFAPALLYFIPLSFQSWYFFFVVFLIAQYHEFNLFAALFKIFCLYLILFHLVLYLIQFQLNCDLKQWRGEQATRETWPKKCHGKPMKQKQTNMASRRKIIAEKKQGTEIHIQTELTK